MTDEPRANDSPSDATGSDDGDAGRLGGEGPDLGRPFKELQGLIEEIACGVRDMPGWVGSSRSRMDVIKAPDAYSYFIDLPGVEKEDLDVSARGAEILIEASRRPVELPEDAVRIQSERLTTPFRRTIRVPADGDVGSVSARLKKGVLRIRVGRAPEGGATKINLED